MPTKIEQVAAMLTGLDKYELECVVSLARGELETRPNTGCKLLALPAELRFIIYELVARDQLLTCDSYLQFNTRCALFGLNKQLRVEFMDLCYSKKVVSKFDLVSVEFKGEGEVAEMSWQTFDNHRFKKVLLDGGTGIDTIAVHTREIAERMIRRRIEDQAFRLYHDIDTALVDDVTVYGIYELGGEDLDKRNVGYVVFIIKKPTIEGKGLWDEMPAFVEYKRVYSEDTVL